DKLKQLTAELNAVQLAWVSGYLAATANAGGNQAQLVPVSDTQAAQTVTILYGSQTGNGRGIAKALAEKAKAQGYSVNLASMGEYNVRQLKQETLLLLVVSTHGEGEAPDDAIELHKFLASKRAPQLNNLHYSVLALGDSSYEFFCQTGKDFDARLSALGAKALLPLVECDVDYEAAAGQWHADVLTAVKPLIQTTANVVAMNEINSTSAQVASEGEFTKQNPYSAEVLVSQKITGRGSDRDVRHVEIDLGESGLRYEVGDALGVWFSNSETLVDEILAGLGLAADAKVTVANESISLKQALIEKKELTQLYPGLVKTWAELSASPELLTISEDKEQVRQFILHHQFADLVANYQLKADAHLDANKLVELLRPLTPRLYSIASSQSEVDTEVHLTVALVEDEHQGQTRFGGASHFLASAQEGAEVKVYVEPNKHFRLPEDPQTPVIMIGPGTGVAPFRAFMQERVAQGAEGDSWLFFGNPHFEQDFLYQTEWQQYLKNGDLTRIDVAFSRDQAHKIYVQHRIKEQ
ncbi:MAG: assimilatory sulfite reductase (NADPH) flavoprotein subunit, partial [Serratia marcescens]|nr:assimilatory sulfite reductase (NADPH) flavoprotein subunit [Serratia marcescens]